MIEGEVLHRDSIGSMQWIRPGEVNLMTAGRGIAHAEESDGGTAGRVHAAQLWIALPDPLRDMPPAFEHHPSLPTLELDGVRITVLVGSAFGLSSPVKVHSPLVAIDLACETASALPLVLDSDFEHAILPLAGDVRIDDQAVPPDTLAFLGAGRSEAVVSTRDAARLLVIGGAPFDEPVLVWWNFVARTQDEIVAAAQDWNAGRRFGEVKDAEAQRIPAPDVSGLHLRRGRG
jgi:redox-sensitive bicupin YhaK (pirin superfamily)